MSWGINLKSDKAITADLIDEVCSDLPDELRGPFGCRSGREWWSMAVDIWFRPVEPNIIRLTGAGFSRGIATGFSETFARRLEKRGISIEIGEMT
jgi:hypothetical protein